MTPRGGRVPITDVDVPGSDGWWLRRLSKSMNAQPARPMSRIADSERYEFGRRDWMDRLWARYAGEAPLTRTSQKYVEATREFLRMARANYSKTVVDALLNHTQLVGVRTTTDNDADGDDVCRRILTDNGMFMQDALTYAFTVGTGFTMVGPPAEGEASALVTAEDPRQVVVSTDPARPGVVRAALKMYHDPDLGEHTAHLFLRAGADPVTGERRGDRVRVARRPGRVWSGASFSASSWEWDDDPEVSGEFAVQGLGVPVVPVQNRFGVGEFEPFWDLLNRIDNGISDRLWTAKYQTYLQRAIKGDLPDTDEDGRVVDYDKVFEADPGALWRLPDGVDIWESRQVDLQPLLAGVREDIKELSSGTFTPLIMFTPDAMSGTAEGATLTREGLTFKAEDRTRRVDPAVIRTFRLALAYSTHDGAQDRARTELQTMWAPMERFSLAQRGAAAVQAQQSGVPQRSILSDVWQFAPETVKRMESERATDLLFQAQVPSGGAGGGRDVA